MGVEWARQARQTGNLESWQTLAGLTARRLAERALAGGYLAAVSAVLGDGRGLGFGRHRWATLWGCRLAEIAVKIAPRAALTKPRQSPRCCFSPRRLALAPTAPSPKSFIIRPFAPRSGSRTHHAPCKQTPALAPLRHHINKHSVRSCLVAQQPLHQDRITTPAQAHRGLRHIPIQLQDPPFSHFVDLRHHHIARASRS